MAPKTLGSMSLTHFYKFVGLLWDPQIDQKSIFGEKGCSKERLFIGLVANAAFLDFLIDLWSIFDEISMQK